ncbi:MAG TPA: ABC transporter substrate-binding protein [Stellaceae bacterium]|jgi:peptide/nickel transport system substrate-binding protein|nr:ABC transporter substrate-binding protein [Stellaceae bacterium]
MINILRGFSGVAIAAALAALMLAPEAFAQTSGKNIKFIPEADLRSLDPIWTTAYITRNHGYMVYDTLFALDEHFKPQPQMVDHWKISDDKLIYTFTLRDKLKFHDGQPVRSADCIASLQRWMKRDALGQAMAESVGEMKAEDDSTFSIILKKPFPLLLEAIGKLSSNVPFIMPERVAKTDAGTQITDPTGSGPFKFVKEEWVPGNKAIYVKNADYVPRSEPPSWASGGKVVKVDRVEWLYIPDSATAAAAINAGEVDWWQQMPPDLVPLLSKNKDITIASVDPLGSLGVMRFNHLQPPFNNQTLRQAMLYVVDQKDVMTALGGEDQKFWKTCYSYFTCGTPMSNEAGAGPLKGKRDLDKAKALVKESGYKGERIVMMTATDQWIVNSQAQVVAQELREIGLNVDLQAMDWGTLITRRTNKEGIDKNGWSIFFTWLVGPDMINPALNFPLRANGEKAWFGWPTDTKLEAMRVQWMDAPDLAAQQRLAAAEQEEAFTSVPFVPTGQFVIPTAFRSNLKGVIVAPIVLMWNVEKK